MKMGGFHAQYPVGPIQTLIRQEVVSPQYFKSMSLSNPTRLVSMPTNPCVRFIHD